MKKVILTSGLALVSFFSKAQIAEVKEDGSSFRIYDDEGYKTSIQNCSDCYLAGYNSQYVVIVDGRNAKIYNEKGDYRTSITICSDCEIQNVSGTYILIKDGSSTKYYNFKGDYVKSN